MRRTTPLVAGACALALTLLAGRSSAVPLLVQTDPNGLAFHSSLTTATSGFYEILNTGTDINGTIYGAPDANGFGFNGSLMWIAGPTVAPPSNNEIDTDLTNGVQSYAEYTVRFTAQGTYAFWLSGQRTGSPQAVAEGRPTGDNDSLWISAQNSDHTATTGWTFLTFASGMISYRSATYRTQANVVTTAPLWVIDGSNVNTDLTLTIGLREDGPIYDRIAFVLEGSGVAPGDLVTIPEPSGWTLGLAAAGLALVCRVRRGRRLSNGAG